MVKKSLKETNPYLKDPRKRHELFVTFVSSSTAIETPFTNDMLREVLQSSEPDSMSGLIRESEEPDQSPP
jgi:hypothetical protein